MRHAASRRTKRSSGQGTEQNPAVLREAGAQTGSVPWIAAAARETRYCRFPMRVHVTGAKKEPALTLAFSSDFGYETAGRGGSYFTEGRRKAGNHIQRSQRSSPKEESTETQSKTRGLLNQFSMLQVTSHPPREDPLEIQPTAMSTLVSFLFLGFFLGMRHATDADHVIAVSTIVSRQRSIRMAALTGVLWGFGHTLTILLVGGAIIFGGLVIPLRLGLSLELAVALMLMLLGLLSLRALGDPVRDRPPPEPRERSVRHSHPHSHGDYVHSHCHGHGIGEHRHREEEMPQAWLDGRRGGLALYQAFRPLLVGVVHGLAGSAAVALLILPIIRDPVGGILYLLLFGLGTVMGMMLITVVIAVPFAWTSKGLTHVNRYLRMAAALLSLGFGLFLFYQIGFVEGLFGMTLRWNPL
jgi:hypothetical protein